MSVGSELVEASPKLFISYRWSSPAHEDWVLALATSLRSNGVDVILDKWALKEGHDAYAFMERLATDVEVKKVLLICDAGYVDRANRREGGVGTEAQIVSPQVYEKADQDKFAAAVLEFESDGKPFLPVYMKNRIYFDLSTEEAYGTNFEKIVRWAFDEPFYVAPPLGKRPQFLNEKYNTGGAATNLFAMRVAKNSGNGVGSRNAADGVLKQISIFLPTLRLDLVDVVGIYILYLAA